MFSCVVCQGVDSRGERLWDKGYEAAVRGSVAATPGPTAHQAAVPFTISQSLLRLTSIESGMPSKTFFHLGDRIDPFFRGWEETFS